tara:strand:- start:129 stop:374 length:246 start_codon:yes stop_codon:yes gene_type:complete
MNNELQEQLTMITDLHRSASNSSRIFVMKQVIRDLQAIVNKSVQSENDKYQGESMMKAMTKIADLMIRYQKEVNEEENMKK